MCRVESANKSVNFAAPCNKSEIPEIEKKNFMADLTFQLDGYDEMIGKHSA